MTDDDWQKLGEWMAHETGMSVNEAVAGLKRLYSLGAIEPVIDKATGAIDIKALMPGAANGSGITTGVSS